MMTKKAIKIFWDWFLKNESSLYFGLENEGERDKLLKGVSSQLKAINENMVYEFSRIRKDNTKEFCISADGIKEAFEDVKRLISAAPQHDHWEFTAFRQRMSQDDLQIKMGDIKIGYHDIYFRYAEQDGELGIELNVRGYMESGRVQNAVFILMDCLLGEYDAVMEIDWVDWVVLDESNRENLLPFIELRTLVDERKAER